MRKKHLLRLKKWQNILHVTELENGFKMHWGYVLEAQMLSMYPTALLFCSMDSPDMVLHSKNLFGGV